MGRKRRVEVIDEKEDDEIPNDEELGDLPIEAQDVIAALAELDGASDAKWKVHRIDPVPDGKPKGFCGTLPASQFSLENIQKLYGRGSYRVIGHTSGGQYIKGGSKTIDIATDPPLGHDAVHETKSQSGSLEVITMLEKMNEREERRAEKSSQLWALALPAAIAAIPGVFQALFGNRKETDPVQMLAALKSLSPQAPDMSGLVAKLIEVAAGKSDGGAETNWMDLVKEAITQVGPMLGGKLVTASATPLIQSQPVPQAQLTSQPSQSESPMLALLAWLKKTLSMLIDKAQRMKDPSLYADVVLDDVPEGVEVAQFVQYLNAPNWWDALVKFDSRVAPYKVWFTQFREDLLSAYEESQREFEEVEPMKPTDKTHTATVHEFKPGVTHPPETFFSDLPPEFEPPSAS